MIKRVAWMSVLGIVWSTQASAATYRWVEWTAADVQAGTASGTIPVDDGAVTVTFSAKKPDGATGSLYGAQTNGGGSTFWLPLTTFQSAQVENAPPRPDLLQLSGGGEVVYTVTLSEPIVNPVMSLVSLGSLSGPMTYDFNAPFTIVSQGPSASFGGSDTALVQLPGDVLQGTEGSGVIQFQGTFSTFAWTVPVPESWHGFTFGILTTKALFDAGISGPGAPVIDASAPVTPVFDAGTPDLSFTAPNSNDDGCGCLVVGGRDMSAIAPVGTLFALGITMSRRRRSNRN